MAVPGLRSSFSACLSVLLVPALLAAAAVAAHMSGLDRHLTDRFFDPASGTFPWRSAPLLETIGHGLARSAVTLIWSLTAAAALAAGWVAELRPYRTLLCSIAIAMALGPLLVVLLKEITAFPCPWNLRTYGGFSDVPTQWFVAPSRAGKCFPAGHSAGGFSLVAFYFAGRAIRSRRLAGAALALTLVLGVALSMVRVMQGAHFVSHALWSASIDWLAAALVFMPSLPGLRRLPAIRTDAAANAPAVATQRDGR
jgi:membrane-associated PAP2 superfamily phosphatase